MRGIFFVYSNMVMYDIAFRRNNFINEFVLRG